MNAINMIEQSKVEFVNTYKKLNNDLKNSSLELESNTVFSIFDSLDLLIYIIDIDKNELIYANNTLVSQLNHNPIGKKCYNEFFNLQNPCRLCEYQIDHLQKVNIYKTEIFNKHLNKYLKIKEIKIDSNSEQNYVFGIAEDITELIKYKDKFNAPIVPEYNTVSVNNDVSLRDSERNTSEKNLEQSLTLLSSTLDSILEAVISFDCNNIFISCNNQFIKMFELDEVQLHGLSEIDIIYLVIKKVEHSENYLGQFFDLINDSNLEIREKLFFNNGKIYEVFAKNHVRNKNTIGRVWSFHDITERYHAEEKLFSYTKDLIQTKKSLEEQKSKLEETIHELAKSKEVAELATRTKSEFLANMSHEIRTPLNSILGFAQVLKDGIIDNKQKKLIDEILSSGKNLLMLFNDILDLSKIETGKLELYYNPINLQKILNEINKIFKDTAKRKKLEFTFDVEKSLPYFLLLDETRIRQILFNLVGNAIKFTEKGFVKVKINTNKAVTQTENNKLEAVDLTLFIEDSGIGISNEMQTQIFSPFNNTQEINNKKYSGTGLGLAITKRLVNMMGGDIFVKSKLGKGSTFEVKLYSIGVSKNDAIDIKDDLSIESNNTSSDDNNSILIDYLGNSLPDVDKQTIEKILPLLNSKILANWHSIAKSGVVDNIRVFALQIIELGNINNIANLKQYGELLLEQVDNFDFEKFPKTLTNFPLLIEKFRSILEQK